MTPLQQIPAQVRAILYWTGYILGTLATLVGLVATVVTAASPDVAPPLWLGITTTVLGFIVTQLNGLAGANVQTTDPSTREHRKP